MPDKFDPCLLSPFRNRLEALQVFEFLTGHELFEMKTNPEEGLDSVTSCHLWQMLCWTQDRISRVQVEASTLGTQYFDLPDTPDDPWCWFLLLNYEPCIDDSRNTSGNLKGRPRIYNSPIWAIIRKYDVLEEEDVFATANLIKRCLLFNPLARASAQELLQDPWFQDAEGSSEDRLL